MEPLEQILQEITAFETHLSRRSFTADEFDSYGERRSGKVAPANLTRASRVAPPRNLARARVSLRLLSQPKTLPRC